MAHVVNGRDGQPKNLGVKAFAGETVKSGAVILRQKGLRFKPGQNVGAGKDGTLYSLADGKVKYTPKKVVSIIQTKTK